MNSDKGKCVCTNEIYLYDGTFEGLLTVIFDCWNNKSLSGIYTEKLHQPKFTELITAVTTDESKAFRVQAWILNAFGEKILTKIYRAFLTEEEDVEIYIFRYLKLLFKKGKSIFKDIADPLIDRIENYERAFSGETHKMYGFTRFEETKDGILFSIINTRYNQLEPLMKFFCNRYSGKRIVIYDLGREKAAVYDGINSYLIDNPPWINKFINCKESGAYEKMWREYLEALSIKERKNYKLQRQMMPLRYRPFMTEFNY
jgi:probable DNA metabolism protein